MVSLTENFSLGRAKVQLLHPEGLSLVKFTSTWSVNYPKELTDSMRKAHERAVNGLTVTACALDSAYPELCRAIESYCRHDVEATKEACNAMYRRQKYTNNTATLSNHIEKVIYNDPATIILWEDGTRTVVKCQNGESYDPEKGLVMAMAKKALGNNYSYYNQIKMLLPKDYESAGKEVK